MNDKSDSFYNFWNITEFHNFLNYTTASADIKVDNKDNSFHNFTWRRKRFQTCELVQDLISMNMDIISMSQTIKWATYTVSMIGCMQKWVVLSEMCIAKFINNKHELEPL